MKKDRNLSPASKAAGNIFLAIFGAVAMVGILGAGVMNFSKGPIQGAINLNRINATNVEMSIAGQALIMSATNTANKGDCDADGYVEPPEMRVPTSAGAKPLNGGLIPNSVGIAKKDPWGTEYGYCAWDHGAGRLTNACQSTSGVNKRLQGYDSKDYPVIAIISAGPDGVFNTTCRNFSAGANIADLNGNGILDANESPLVSKDTASADDIIYTYTYQDAMAASGGLWRLKSSDANTAYINKKIETQGATIAGTGSFQRLAALGADFLDLISPLKLPDLTLMPNCNAGNRGALRRAVSGYSLEICDGGAWVTTGGGPTTINELDDAITNYSKNNIFGGRDAGNESVSGAGNSSFGIGSLKNLTTGNYNSALGFEALKNTTTGSRNSAAGYRAGMALTGDSNDNTMVGYEALLSCVTCSNATAVGAQALRNSLVGNNTAVGAYSMLSNVGGEWNTAFGYETLRNMTSGSYNSALGFQALREIGAMTVSSNNTAVGSQAMYQVISGQQNTAVGYRAIGGAGNANRNTAIGTTSMATLTNGNDNVAVGANAMPNTTTGSENVAIGANSLNAPGGSSLSETTIVGSNVSGLNFLTGARNTLINGGGVQLAGGTDNTAVNGGLTLPMSGIGVHNTSIGRTALTRGGSSSYNTVVGYNAGSNTGNGLTGADSNTVLGYGALATNTSGANNTVIGDYAGQNMVGPNNNTAVGNNAMRYHTVGQNTTSYGDNTCGATSTNLGGSDNTCAGSTAGEKMKGASNIAVGYQAIQSGVMTGTENIAVGRGAGMYLTTQNRTISLGLANNVSSANMGDDTISIGSSGGQRLPSKSIGIGYYGFAASGGSSNEGNICIASCSIANNIAKSTIMGTYSLTNNPSGSSNTVAGIRAMRGSASQTGSNNSFAGSYAGTANNTGSDNTLVGGYAMTESAATSNNSGLGMQSLSNISSGNNNTAIGFSALRGATASATISNSVAIGKDAGLNFTSGIDNAIAIGTSTTLTVSNKIRLGNTSVTTISGQVAYTVASDKRLKKDIAPTDLGLDFIMKLKPVSFRMIDGNGRLDYGFIAQDLELALEGRKTNMLIRSNDKMQAYKVRGDDLISPLVRAIQEQQAELENLEKDLDSIK